MKTQKSKLEGTRRPYERKRSILRSLLSIRDLELLAVLRDGGSLSAAARRLGVTQSAVSKAASRMEERLGLSLFEAGLHTMLNVRGCRLAEHAAAIHGELSELRRTIRKLRLEKSALRGASGAGWARGRAGGA